MANADRTVSQAPPDEDLMESFHPDMRVALEGGDGGTQEAALADLGVEPDEAQLPFIPLPWLLKASGLYRYRPQFILPTPIPIPQPVPIPRPSPAQPAADGEAGFEELVDTEFSPILPWWFRREDLRLDVDGRYPQMRASGALYNGPALRVHWIANLARTGLNTYAGPIWYKDGTTSALPHTTVRIKVVRSWYSHQRTATVTFSGGGSPQRVRTYRWKSAYFHPVEFEYDHVQGTTPVTSIQTHDHPNRPASLQNETLTIKKVFRRAGFNVRKGADNAIPLPAGGTWSDMEMHDAMQVHWSRFASEAQWAMWVLFAGLHEAGTSLGGIMFDDIGPNHRQGTALFNDSFISSAPPGDANPAAWVRRMKFWTAVHEMGHAFNLAHSWQKALVYQGNGPWIPLANEPEARSFMNYPYGVTGGQAAFFADFEFRFSDNELLFLRHAPERFVQMGNADWFDHHGFEQEGQDHAAPYRLEARVHRDLGHFEFMEPVSIELKLTNTSGQPQLVDEKVLEEAGEMTVVVKRRGMPAQLWRPFARHCYRGAQRALEPGASMYGQLFVGAGLGGWMLAEPGVYTIQVALHHDDHDVVSPPLEVRVAPPRGYEEELLAQDFFTEEVGRTLAFDGTRVLEEANDTLREVVERLPERRVAYHARLALANPLTRDYKLLQVEGGDRAADGDREQRFKVLKAKPDAARAQLEEALTEHPQEAAESLGHIDYRRQVEQFGAFLDEEGDPAAAASVLQTAEKALKARGVLDRVVEDLEAQRKAYASKKGGSSRSKKSKK